MDVSKKRKRDGSGMQDLNSESSQESSQVASRAPSPSSYDPYFATNSPPNGDWTRAQWTMAPPYVPPYDPSLPPLMMPPPTPMMPPHMMPPPMMITAPPPPPPPPYVSRSAAPPKFAPASQRRGLHFWRNGPSEAIATYGCRGKRQGEALLFKHFTISPQNIKSVRKSCIRENATYNLLDKSLGITWVAVRGMDSMCVVTRNCDLVHLEREVLSRGEKCDNEHFLRSFWNVIVCEVEAIEGPSGEAFNDSSVKPFGVVCVISGNNEVQKVSGHEASSVEYDADKAIKFLQEEIKTDSAFTFDKTVMTAISAFQHLFLQKFEADEIRVFAWKKGYVIGKEMQQEREDPDAEELLASLNGPNNDHDTV